MPWLYNQKLLPNASTATQQPCDFGQELSVLPLQVGDNDDSLASGNAVRACAEGALDAGHHYFHVSNSIYLISYKKAPDISFSVRLS